MASLYQPVILMFRCVVCNLVLYLMLGVRENHGTWLGFRRGCWAIGVPRNFVRGGGGVQQIQLRTEDRENGDLGAVAP